MSKEDTKQIFNLNYGTCEKISTRGNEKDMCIDYSDASGQSSGCCMNVTHLCKRTCMLHKICNTQTWITILKYFIRLFIFLIFFGISSMLGKIVTMVYVVPRVDVHAPPASDLLLEFFKHANPNAFKAAEVTTGVLTFILVIISLIHSKERFYILPRFLFISGTLINLRTLCISITTFSIPTRELTHACIKLQSLPRQDLLWKSINFFEFSETCGDYVFSGHATALIVVAWFVWYYGRSIPIQMCLYKEPASTSLMKHVLKLMNVILICMVLVGCLCILFAKEHYSVDVVVGGVISIMWCSLYHLLIDIYRKHSSDSHNNNREDCEHGHSSTLNTSSECLFMWFYIVEGAWKDYDTEIN